MSNLSQPEAPIKGESDAKYDRTASDFIDQDLNDRRRPAAQRTEALPDVENQAIEGRDTIVPKPNGVTSQGGENPASLSGTNVVTLVAPFLDRIERRLDIDMVAAAVEIELTVNEPLVVLMAEHHRAFSRPDKGDPRPAA